MSERTVVVTTVYSVVGQHRTVPGLLLLHGDDNRYYAYAAGRTSPVEPTAAWVFDTDGRPGMEPSPVAAAPVSVSPVPDRAARRIASQHVTTTGRVSAWRHVRVLAAVLALILGVMPGGPAALAHAPALATTETDVDLLPAPSAGAPVLVVLPVGTEVELTGAADGEFLEVSAAGQVGWADADDLDGGIDTAPVVLDASLHAAPSEDGEILGAVQAGSTVILTGASVDGYVAAAFGGTGGWLPASAIA